MRISMIAVVCLVAAVSCSACGNKPGKSDEPIDEAFVLDTSPDRKAALSRYLKEVETASEDLAGLAASDALVRLGHYRQAFDLLDGVEPSATRLKLSLVAAAGAGDMNALVSSLSNSGISDRADSRFVFTAVISNKNAPPQQVVQLAREFLAQSGGDNQLRDLLLVAEIERRAGNPERTVAMLSKLVKSKPEELDERYGCVIYAQALSDLGRIEQLDKFVDGILKPILKAGYDRGYEDLQLALIRASAFVNSDSADATDTIDVAVKFMRYHLAEPRSLFLLFGTMAPFSISLPPVVRIHTYLRDRIKACESSECQDLARLRVLFKSVLIYEVMVRLASLDHRRVDRLLEVASGLPATGLPSGNDLGPYYRAVNAELQGRYDEARAGYRESPRGSIDFLAPYLGEARTSLALGDAQSALDVLKTIPASTLGRGLNFGESRLLEDLCRNDRSASKTELGGAASREDKKEAILSVNLRLTLDRWNPPSYNTFLNTWYALVFERRWNVATTHPETGFIFDRMRNHYGESSISGLWLKRLTLELRARITSDKSHPVIADPPASFHEFTPHPFFSITRLSWVIK